jgi:hypothetical protein
MQQLKKHARTAAVLANASYDNSILIVLQHCASFVVVPLHAGGYAGYSEEMCIMLLHYYPRNALLRGCMAVTKQQGGHSICMYEGASFIGFQNSESNRVPIRGAGVPHVQRVAASFTSYLQLSTFSSLCRFASDTNRLHDRLKKKDAWHLDLPLSTECIRASVLRHCA